MRASIATCNDRFVGLEHDDLSTKSADAACELRNAELPWFCPLQHT
jgi:hypothetical protein